MNTATLSRTDLFKDLDDAEVVAEFAKITGDLDLLRAAEADIRHLVAQAHDRGFILDVFNCEVGDLVQNMHGDTGVITDQSIPGGIVAVRWDAPTTHRSRYTAAHLLTGALRHRN